MTFNLFVMIIIKRFSASGVISYRHYSCFAIVLDMNHINDVNISDDGYNDQ